MIDAAVPHLDRPFDYRVPAALDATATVGARVRVRFAGRLTDGFVVGRMNVGEHEGRLSPLERVIGAEPPLTAQTLALVDAVAQRYAGTFSDVVRAAVPPRHARAEAAAAAPSHFRAPFDDNARRRWQAYSGGAALFDRLTTGTSHGVRAVWSCAPATSWADDVSALVEGVLTGESGGVLVVVPDARDVERLLARLPQARTAGVVATLTADQGPERRYREFLRARRGLARVVIGTRSAVFAPVADLRLIVIWDDGDDALVEPHSPYWEARDVAALRSHQSDCALVVGSPARSVVTQQWVTTGWAKSLTATKPTLAARAPRVSAISVGDSARDEAAGAARVPHRAWEVARATLATGPVLVSVARRGYLPVLACQKCREVAHCGCGGPLSLASGDAVPQCTWCGALSGGWECPYCGSRRLRAVAVGAQRTAEEIGRAFPGVPVISSHGDRILSSVPDSPALVVATSGAEPDVEGGYAGVLILDARSVLHRPHLDAQEDAIRRWFAAARLARPKAPVVVTADNSLAPVQSLVRWDAPWLAARELAERAATGLPPATRVAALFGLPPDIAEVTSSLTLDHRLLGPVEVEPGRSRCLVVVERTAGGELARQLRAITATRSARAKDGVVHVHLDPREI
jgi:primosomal protein N' (replication factor Y)